MPYVVLAGASPEMPRDGSHQSEVEYSSVLSNCSSEAFESFTEEVEEGEEQCQPSEGKASGSLSSSEERQTASSASGSYPVSKNLMLDLKNGDEPLYPLDSAAVEEKLSQKWIQLLKGKESQTGQPQTGPTFQAVTEPESAGDRKEGILPSLHRASAVREHKCSQCLGCTKKRGELSQLTFLRQKKTFLESALLKEKM